MGNLTLLWELRVSDYAWSGSIPLKLSHLTNLDELFLTSQTSEPLTGCVPADLLRVPLNDLFGLRAPVCGAERGSPESDKDALIALYNAADGANWTHNYNWLSDAPIGGWQGAETDPSGRVIRLRLGNSQLSGRIPSELGDLTNLGYLALHNNQMTGSIPPQLDDLNSLSTLSLHGNQLSGSIRGRLAISQDCNGWITPATVLAEPFP